MGFLDRYFGVGAAGSSLRREIVGGLTTFATMSYIVLVQPTILSAAGMPAGSVLLATCFSSAIGCFLMGILARYPYALAPGMGENFLFSFTVVLAMGFSWQAALAIVFLSGVLFVLFSLVRLRETLLTALPDCLKYAIGPAIGLFIAFVGLQWAGIVVLNPGTMVALGDLRQGPPLIVMAGILVSGVLLSRGFGGAILAGLALTTVLGLVTGVLAWKVDAAPLSTETFFRLDFAPLFERPTEALVAIGLFFFLILFDTVGTLIGVSSQAGFLHDDGTIPRSGRAFLSDALSTCVGALFGTSTVTCYVESATGVAAGARTGLAAVVTGLCFLAAVAAAPLVAVVGQDVGPAYYAALGVEHALVAMHPAVAPALIVVGFMMLPTLARVRWSDATEGLPAFFTVAGMSFGYGITEGVSAGCISYVALKCAAGRWREVHPLMFAVGVALAFRYAVLR